MPANIPSTSDPSPSRACDPSIVKPGIVGFSCVGQGFPALPHMKYIGFAMQGEAVGQGP
jgi:hypothetical protein